MAGRFLRHLIVSACFLLINIYSARAQSEIDSLRKLLSNTQNEQRVEVLNDLASYLLTIEPQESKALLDESLGLSESLTYNEGKVKGLLILATYYSQNSFLSRTEEVLEQALALARGMDYQDGLAKGELTMGALRRRQGRFAEAIAHNVKGISYAQELGDVHLEMILTMNIGEINQRIGDLVEAEKFLLRSLDIGIKNELNFRVGQSYLNLAVLEYQKQNLGSSIDYNQKALEIFRSEGDKSNAARALNNLGFAHNLIGDTDKAIAYYEESMRLKEEVGDVKGMVKTIINQARILEENRQMNRALDLTHEALELAESISDATSRMLVHSFLSEYYERRSNVTLAYNHFKRQSAIKDSLNLLSNDARVKELTAQFEFERLERENDLQQQRNELQSLRIAQRNQLIVIISVVFVLVIVWLIWNGTSLRNKLKLSQKDQLITQKNAEIRIRELDIEKEKLIEYSDRLLSKNKSLEETRKMLESAQLTNEEEKNEVDQLVEKLKTSIVGEKDWASFRLYFDVVYPDYFHKLRKKKGVDLTLSEQRIACLLKIKLTSKETSEILGISPDSVLKSKTRLRQKLNFDTVKAMEGFLTDL